MTIIFQHADLKDSWAITHPNIQTSHVVSAQQAIQQLGITADSPLNSWSAGKLYARGTWGKRIDYVLYRQPNCSDQTLPILKAIDTKVVLTETVPGRSFSISDHFGLEATFEITSQISDEDTDSNLNAQPQRPSELSTSSINTTIHALTACYRFSRERSRRELIIFGLCILILVGVVIGTAWLPHSWINPIFILFTVLVAWLATTMLYEGFIFGNWECNALMNVIEELEIHRKGQEILNGRSRD